MIIVIWVLIFMIQLHASGQGCAYPVITRMSRGSSAPSAPWWRVMTRSLVHTVQPFSHSVRYDLNNWQHYLGY